MLPYVLIDEKEKHSSGNFQPQGESSFQTEMWVNSIVNRAKSSKNSIMG